MGLIFLLLWMVPVFVSSAAGHEEGGDIQDELPAETDDQAMDNVHNMASKGLLKTAQWLDSFFDDSRAEVEENTTRATIKAALGYSRKDDVEIKPGISLRLRLPRFSERVNIFFDGGGDSDLNITQDPLADRPADKDGESRALNTGLRYFFKESETYNIHFDAGLSWNYLYAGVRFRAMQDFGIWQGRLTNRFRYYTDDGLENRTGYDLERRITDRLLFRTTAAVNLYEDVRGVPHSLSVRLYQVISPTQAISYEMGVYLDTSPDYRATDTQFLLRYRQRLLRDWLIFEISPRLTFPEPDRRANPGILVSFEATFGHASDKEEYRRIFRSQSLGTPMK